MPYRAKIVATGVVVSHARAI